MRMLMLRHLIGGLVTLLGVVAAEAHAFLSQAVPQIRGQFIVAVFAAA